MSYVICNSNSPEKSSKKCKKVPKSAKNKSMNNQNLVTLYKDVFVFHRIAMELYGHSKHYFEFSSFSVVFTQLYNQHCFG